MYKVGLEAFRPKEISTIQERTRQSHEKSVVHHPNCTASNCILRPGRGLQQASEAQVEQAKKVRIASEGGRKRQLRTADSQAPEKQSRAIVAEVAEEKGRALGDHAN